jgi:hypothetical protein
MATDDAFYQQIEADIWDWIDDFITAKSEFYNNKFAPCPFARAAVEAKTVDVMVYQSGDVRQFIRDCAVGMRDNPKLTTRVMAFPPKIQHHWGLGEYVEDLNLELVPTNIFLNCGLAQTTRSRYPGSRPNEPYSIIIANSLAAVLAGCESLKKTDFYKNWPAKHYALVVERRARLAEGRLPPAEAS